MKWPGIACSALLASCIGAGAALRPPSAIPKLLHRPPLKGTQALTEPRFPRRAQLPPLRSLPQLPGGGGGSGGGALLAKLKRDSKGNLRLCVALEAVIGAVSRALLGTNADVKVKARSNRDVLKGKLSTLSVDSGAMAGLLLSARGGSLRGTQLDLGLRPLLVFLYFPVLLFGLVDFLSLTLFTMLAYSLLPAASPSSSLQYTLSLTEQDMNSSFAIRWMLKVALSALMQNSLLVSALSSAGSVGQEGAWMQRLASATDYRLSSTSLQVSAGGLFGGGSGSGRLIMAATGSMLNTINGPMVARSNQCIFVEPEILVTPGWPLPEFWLPVGSGVAIDLGLANCINSLDFVASDGSSGASGGLQVQKIKVAG